MRVNRIGGGKSGAIVYRVWVDENDVGVFKLFGRDGAADEQKMLKLLSDAKLTKMHAVRERGTIGVETKGFGSALLMDAAQGKTVKELIEAFPSAGSPERENAALQLQFAVTRVAEGLAELHMKFEAGGTLMTNEAKLNDANYMLDKNVRGGSDVAQVRASLGDRDFERVKARLEGPELESFLAAKVPATAYHGDANAGNFLVGGGYNDETGYKELAVIDVAQMRWSLDEKHKGTKTGAADVARFLESLETVAPGTLSETELQRMRDAFMKRYLKFLAEKGHGVDRAQFDQAERWYRIEMELAVIKSDATAKPRLLQLLGLEGTP